MISKRYSVHIITTTGPNIIIRRWTKMGAILTAADQIRGGADPWHVAVMDRVTFQRVNLV